MKSRNGGGMVDSIVANLWEFVCSMTTIEIKVAVEKKGVCAYQTLRNLEVTLEWVSIEGDVLGRRLVGALRVCPLLKVAEQAHVAGSPERVGSEKEPRAGTARKSSKVDADHL
eukprot:4301898-Amphidinium_carterae.1